MRITQIRAIRDIIVAALLLSGGGVGCEKNDAVSVARKGRELAEKGNTTDAEKEFVRALKENPDYADARLELGRIYEGRDDYDNAEAAYREVLRRQPNHINAHLYLGNVLRKIGNLVDAMSEVEIAHKSAPSDTRILRILSNLQEQVGEIDLAFSTIQKAITIDQNDHYVRLDAGRLLEKKGDNSRAILQYKKVYELVHGLPSHIEEEALAVKKIRELQGS